MFRLAGVNRALEGLAIDVFTTMRDFADDMDDPVLRFCRGLDAGRRGDPREDGLHVAARGDQGRPRAPHAAPSSSRSTVDGLFNFRGLRGEDEESAIRLARRFRELAGFDTAEIDDIAEQAAAQRAERMAASAS